MRIRKTIFSRTKKGKVTYTGEHYVSAVAVMSGQFMNGGTKLLYMVHNGDYIRSFPASTPYSILGLGTGVNSPAISEDPGAAPKSFRFSNDGLKLIVGGASVIMSYSLISPYVLTGWTYDGNFSLSASYIELSSDGHLLFCNNGNLVRVYQLTNAWDISVKALLYTKSISTANGIWFSGDGKFFFTILTPGIVRKYILTTAYDLNTASSPYTLNLGALTPAGNFASISFSPDGLKMLITHYANNSWTFNLEKPYDISGKLIL